MSQFYERQPVVVDAQQYTANLDPLPPNVTVDESGAAWLQIGPPDLRVPIHLTDWILTSYYGNQSVVDDATFQLTYKKNNNPAAQLVP